VLGRPGGGPPTTPLLPSGVHDRTLPQDRRATLPTRLKIVDRLTGEDLTAAVVRCRTYGHAWDEFNPTGMDASDYGWRLSLRCVRCTTERHDVIDTIGNLATRQYIYPEGYDTSTGEARMTRPEFRQLLYARFRKGKSNNKQPNTHTGVA
jgi:hypothetical protein